MSSPPYRDTSWGKVLHAPPPGPVPAWDSRRHHLLLPPLGERWQVSPWGLPMHYNRATRLRAGFGCREKVPAAPRDPEAACSFLDSRERMDNNMGCSSTVGITCYRRIGSRIYRDLCTFGTAITRSVAHWSSNLRNILSLAGLVEQYQHVSYP